MPLKQLMKLPHSSNIHRSSMQSWSKLGSFLKNNCDAECVFYNPTIWTIRAGAMTSVISNYSVLHELWDCHYDWLLDTSTLIEMKARIRGEQVHMQQFELFFGLVLGRNLLQHTDSLSVCLQRKSLSAAEGQAMAAMTISTLKSMTWLTADDTFALFWNDVTTLTECNLVNAPVLPRRRCLPAWYLMKHPSSESDTDTFTLMPLTCWQFL